jgi:hypothetical protein
MLKKLKNWWNTKQEAKKYNQTTEESPTDPKLAKEFATKKKEPWVGVLNTHVNQENVRNGFFELDWNEYFIVQLKQAGYVGDSEEAIMDQWFQDLCRNVGNEEGVDMEKRGSGYINVSSLGNGRSEIS